MAQLPLKQVSWAIYVPKNDIFFAIFCAGFSPYFFLNIESSCFFGPSTPTHSPKSGCECPHRWRNSLISGPWPKNSGALLGADLGRKRACFLAKHGLNIEGYVGPLGALLAAFGPKISTPNGSMVLLRLNFGSVLGLCWAIWRLQKTRVKFYCFTRVFLGAFWSLLGPI